MVTETELTRLVPDRLGRAGARLLARGAVPIAVIAVNRGRQGVRVTVLIPEDVDPAEMQELGITAGARRAPVETEYI